ncbi:hypothetical protein GUITHDRAFT_92283 [Guillardia theta CCMP2712]|uniref:Maf-like protein n=1 Tax=Guillardia theta (strain CCMP2712) TaxID=905079 RepID=L1JWI9_GUITC|nr:hypothetical protein GUITHDRAFT_92283 [Guillardia theta CCMP2712]EKX52699.1 hypothetical protein GUITHDRAFT_92283 [Guillardia theta CCMP2712]|eukprot:XP_005839679.1 hypothetical protein GUITHDRAFT_92283 [Guillardia theta CCMP2712]
MLPANIDEKAIRSEDPEKLVLALANAKADALLQRHCKDGKWTGSEQVDESKVTLLLTSDQVVVHEGRILEKPEDQEEARSFISGYGRSPPSTVGAIAVTNVATGKRVTSLDKATIVFNSIPSDVIEEIVKDDMTLHCAGGLMVEDPRIQPYLVRIEGGMDSVMGLGKRTTRSLLESVLQ